MFNGYDISGLSATKYQTLIEQYVAYLHCGWRHFSDSDIPSAVRLEVIYQVVGCEGGAVVGFSEDLTNNCNLHQVQFQLKCKVNANLRNNRKNFSFGKGFAQRYSFAPKFTFQITAKFY